MKLIAFRVRMYRGIIDSDWVDVNPLTVFVGKNESGKTSLLKALHKLNPYEPESYDIANEWPRGRRSESSEEHVVCCARFRLSDTEKSDLHQMTDMEKIPDIVEVSRNYAGDLEVKFGEEIFLDKSPPVDAYTILSALPSVQDNFSNQFKRCANDCLNEVKHFINERRFTEFGQLVQKHQSVLRRRRVDKGYDSYAIEGEFINKYMARLNQFVHHLEQLPTPPESYKYIRERLPTFVYMDDYRIFSGNAHLMDVQSRKNEDRLTEADNTFLTILELSGLDLDKLISAEQESSQGISRERIRDIRGGAETLTKKISGRFTQRQYEVEYDVDDSFFFTLVTDDHDSSPIELEERSRGFQWYFSFDLMLMHGTKETLKGSVILLDEPGLHLHPGAQKNLLKGLEEYARGNTLLYTTHLPFMINLDQPSQIRILEDRNKEIVVTTDLTERSLDARLVLQAALDMDFSQKFLIEKRNLIVEGVEDYWILTELSNLLRRSGKDGLPEDVLITPGGGATHAVPVAAFMIGQELDMVALFDSDDEGRLAEEKLVHNWLPQYTESLAKVILLGDAVGACGDFALEDLFPDEFYIESVGETYQELEEITLLGDDMLWKRVERALKKEGIVKPNKGPVAKRLRDRISAMKDTSELPDETKEKAIRLFQTIRKAFDEE